MGRYFIEKEHHGQMIIEERTPYYSHKKNNPFSLAIMTTGKKWGKPIKKMVHSLVHGIEKCLYQKWVTAHEVKDWTDLMTNATWSVRRYASEFLTCKVCSHEGMQSTWRHARWDFTNMFKNCKAYVHHLRGIHTILSVSNVTLLPINAMIHFAQLHLGNFLHALCGIPQFSHKVLENVSGKK